MILYHATSEKGYKDICRSQCIKPGPSEEIVYLADSHNRAIRFIAHKVSMKEDIYVFEVEVPDQEVFETFDHNYKIFKCKSYGYKNSIGYGRWTRCTCYPAPGGV